MTKLDFDPVLHVDSAPVQGDEDTPWGASWKLLTPHMRQAGGSLGVCQTTLRTGMVGCPFHWHAREDEVFFVLSGRGILRYGDTVREIGPGDCISCPAGQKVAHQIGNPFEPDLVYLAIGPHDPHEVCGYPDTGKLMVRAIGQVGQMQSKAYLEGEPNPPKIFGLKERETR